MGYIQQTLCYILGNLWDILGNNYRVILGKNCWIYLAKTRDILNKNYRTYYEIYWVKTKGYIGLRLKVLLGIYSEKLCDILVKNYGIYFGINWAKTRGYFMGYIQQKLWDILH